MANHTILDHQATDITEQDTWYALTTEQLPDGIAAHHIAISELLNKQERLDVILPLSDVLDTTGILSEVLQLIANRTSSIGVWANTDTSEEDLERLLAGMQDKEHAVLNALDLIVFYMPAFADGRSFSLAKFLRLQGYEGEIRVAGEFGYDQITYLLRSGVDSFSIADDELIENMQGAFVALPTAYSGDDASQLPMFR